MATDSDQFAARSDNSIHVHPAADFNGQTTVTVQARDAEGAVSQAQSFEVTVDPVNDVPVSVDDAFAVEENDTLNSDSPGVLDNDSDVDGDTLTATLVNGPSHGALTLNADGTFTYTPTANYHGTDSFTYRVNDGSDDGNTVTVTIDVLPRPEFHGTLFHDLDGDASQAADEPGLADWTIFLDTNTK